MVPRVWQVEERAGSTAPAVSSRHATRPAQKSIVQPTLIYLSLVSSVLVDHAKIFSPFQQQTNTREQSADAWLEIKKG